MKEINQIILIVATTLFTFNFSFTQTEPTGMPGDNFSLEGALDLFKKAKSPEHFEELLNKEDNEVNNLDLNGDGDIDYIRVIDNQDKDAHALVLQVPISKSEQQDIAVIAIEKTSKDYAELQIIGDEDIYGEELVIEPFDEEASSDGNGGPDANYRINRVIVNVWLWPSVRYIYAPTYRLYVSPWYWGYYPKWWRPWRPLGWGIYSARTARFRVGFRVAPVVRVRSARTIYRPRRTTSVTVVNRYSVNKKTYVKRGNTTVVKKSSTTTVKGKNNKAVATKSNKKVGVKKGNKKAVVDKKTTKAAGTRGKTKVAGKKKTKTTKVKTKSGKKVKKKKTKTVKKRKR